MKVRVRGLTSLLLGLVFMFLIFSGAILYVAPRGRVANWTGWTIFALDKEQWQAVHVNIAVLFVIVGGMHLWLNWSSFWGYLKRAGGKGFEMKIEVLVAAVLFLVVLVGAILAWPPFGTIMAWNEQIKDYWEQRLEQPPLPHAEELTLAQLARRMNLSIESVQAALQQEGIAAADPSLRVAEIAVRSGKPPREIYAAIKRHFPDAVLESPGKGVGRGEGKGAGKGAGKGGG
jgi:hypothetical protein